LTIVAGFSLEQKIDLKAIPYFQNRHVGKRQQSEPHKKTALFYPAGQNKAVA